MAASLDLVTHLFDTPVSDTSSGFGNEFVIDASGNRFRLHFTPGSSSKKGAQLHIRLAKDASAIGAKIFNAKLTLISSSTPDGPTKLLQNICFQADGRLCNNNDPFAAVTLAKIKLMCPCVIRCQMQLEKVQVSANVGIPSSNVGVPSVNSLVQALDREWNVPDFADVILVVYKFSFFIFTYRRF